MKKKIFSLTIIAALSLIASYNFFKHESKIHLSDLALNNIEALAGAECTTNWSCWLNPSTRKCCNQGSIGCAPCD